MIHTVRSGRHDPTGALWVRNNHHQIVTDKVPLIDVAPTLLAHFGVDQPEHMAGRPLSVTADFSVRETRNQRTGNDALLARNPNGVTPRCLSAVEDNRAAAVACTSAAVANWIGFAACTSIAAAFFVSCSILVHGLGDRRYGIWSLVESVPAYLMLST